MGGTGSWGPKERSSRVETVKLISARLYLGLASLRDEGGQAMVEYALILALVSVAAVAVLQLLGGSVSSICDQINSDL